MKLKPKFIFRWKNIDGHAVEVSPSVADTPEEVWAWATRNLRGATEAPQQGRHNVRKNGEVIPLGDLQP